MPGKGPKQKGAVYERELATYFNDQVFGGKAMATRAPLSGGGRFSLNAGGTDLLGVPGLFVEAKRFENLNFRKAVRQAQGNAILRQTKDYPIVITRRSREATGQSLVVMQLDHFMEMYKAWLREQGHAVATVTAGPLFEQPVEEPAMVVTLQSTGDLPVAEPASSGPAESPPSDEC